MMMFAEARTWAGNGLSLQTSDSETYTKKIAKKNKNANVKG